MAEHYWSWDIQDAVFRGERMPDRDDVERAQRDRPIKMVLPTSRAQISTFASFLFLLFKQNRRFFSLTPNGKEDYGQKEEDLETLLEHNITNQGLSRLLFQHLLDVGRFGPGIFEVGWTRDVSHIKVDDSQVAIVNGITVESRPNSSWQEVVKYEGNLLRNVSPYRWFPDTHFPIVDFQKGEFCAAEEEYAMSRLRDLESAGEVAGLEHIQPFGTDWQRLRDADSRLSYTVNDTYRSHFGYKNRACSVTVTKVQRWIIPSRYKIDGKTALGPETFRVLYHVWYANDNRIIRVEPAVCWHNEFGWTLSQFTPDMHETVTMGLGDLVYRLQDTISFFLNSRVKSVSQFLRNRLIVHPSLVETKTLDSEGDIYIRKGVGAALPPERAIGQLRLTDVTAGHLSDVQVLMQLMQIVTGVNENAMGQFNGGRRSATEARNVASGAASRMKMHAQLIWESGLGRLGRLMVSNLRQGLSYESFQAVIGDGNIDPASGQSDLPSRFGAFRGTPKEVAYGGDYFVFDSTLESEKGFIAQSLQELLTAAMSNPAVMQLWDLDPRALLEEITRLRGIGPISRFSLSARVAAGTASPLPAPAPLQSVA